MTNHFSNKVTVEEGFYVTLGKTKEDYWKVIFRWPSTTFRLTAGSSEEVCNAFEKKVKDTCKDILNKIDHLRSYGEDVEAKEEENDG